MTAQIQVAAVIAAAKAAEAEIAAAFAVDLRLPGCPEWCEESKGHHHTRSRGGLIWTHVDAYAAALDALTDLAQR